MIEAICCIENSIHRADFDATDYFKKATDREILMVLKRNFSHEDFVWEIAAYVCAGGRCQELKSFFEYLDYKNHFFDSPMKCEINKEQALNWLGQNRPHLVASHAF